MATFSGETPVNIVTVDSSGSSSATLYTVPSGRYCKINVREIDSSGVNTPTYSIGGTILPGLFKYSFFGENNISAQDVKVSNDIVLTEGQTIERVGAANSGTFRANIVEFNNP